MFLQLKVSVNVSHKTRASDVCHGSALKYMQKLCFVCMNIALLLLKYAVEISNKTNSVDQSP
jgi:hypothetical protein